MNANGHASPYTFANGSDARSVAAPADKPPARAPLPPSNRIFTIPHFELGDRLTAEQVDFFETFGFIRFKAFKSRAEVRTLVEAVEGVDRALVQEQRSSVFGVPLLIGRRPDGTRCVQRIPFASVLAPELHGFLQDRRFGGILELAGTDYRIGERERDGLVVNQFRREEGSAYSQLGWHTDSLRDVFYLERPRRYLNVGFYLDDSPVEKGGVRVIPLSHRQGIWPMLTRKAYFLDNTPDPAEYAVFAEAGDLTIHDGRIWHRVAKASVDGDASLRRVMYVPLMRGPLKPKDESSPTPLYFRLRRLARF